MDVCELAHSFTNAEQLSLLRMTSRSSYIFRSLLVTCAEVKKRKNNRKKNMKKNRNLRIIDSTPGRFVLAPQSDCVSINNRNLASRSGIWHVMPQSNTRRGGAPTNANHSPSRNQDISMSTHRDNERSKKMATKQNNNNNNIEGMNKRKNVQNLSRRLSSRDCTHPASDHHRMHTSDTGHDSTLNHIHVRGFANDVTASDVRRYAQRKLFRDHITCRMLIRRGVNPSTKDVLSFKIGVPASVTQIVLDPSFWPSGIEARNFIEQRQECNTHSLRWQMAEIN